MADLPDPRLPPSNPWTVAAGTAGIVLALVGLTLMLFFGPDQSLDGPDNGALRGIIGAAMTGAAVACWLAAVVIEGVGWHLRHPR